MQYSLEKLKKITERLNVLYVEDDQVLVQKSLSIFNTLFSEVTVAINGQDALVEYNDYFYEHNKFFDIVITDIKMPIMDGLELSKQIKKINPNQIIVVTSAHDDSKYLIEFINIGITRFIKKPFKFDNIVSTFSNVCEYFISSNENNIINLDNNYSWDRLNKKIYNNNEEIKISNSEALILDLLFNNRSQIFSSLDFYYTIQDDNFDKEFSVDSVKSVIKRIRKKIPKDFIENIYGKGYRVSNKLKF